MRKKIVAGNWKMNTDYQEGLKLASEIINMVSDEIAPDKIVLLAPPFTHLYSIYQLIKGSSQIKLAAQNCSKEQSGAFTGEISPAMLCSVGVEYVIIGHSERRNYYGETDEVIRNKLDNLLKEGLYPIFCCGEQLAERNTGKHFDTVKSQLDNSLLHVSENNIKKVIIAYEPVWAIGTGLNATPEQAQEMHAFIRNILTVRYGSMLAEEITLLYGGSCNAQNASTLFSQKDVDGGLIGGASLKSRDFVNVIKALN